VEMCCNNGVMRERDMAECVYPKEMNGFRVFGFLKPAAAGIYTKEKKLQFVPSPIPAFAGTGWERVSLSRHSHALGVTTAEVRVSRAIRKVWAESRVQVSITGRKQYCGYRAGEQERGPFEHNEDCSCAGSARVEFSGLILDGLKSEVL